MSDETRMTEAEATTEEAGAPQVVAEVVAEGAEMAADGAGAEMAADDAGAEMAADDAGAEMAADDAGAEMAADDAGAEMAADDAGAEMAADDAGAEMAADDAGAEMAADDAGAEMAADDAGAEMAADDAGAEMAADDAGAEMAADDAGAEMAADDAGAEAERVAPSRVEGPANFNRAKQGNQRRNPRHVGNDVRIDEIDYKNVQVLSRFVDNYGRIHNRRKTRVTAKMQRKVTRSIKRARHLALMPYTGEHIRITGRRS